MENYKPVLLLDDSPDLLFLEKKLIEKQCHCETLTAHDFDEVTSIGEKLFDCGLAILDINLGPNQPNGIDVYHWLRSHGFRSPIVFLTGHGRTFPLVAEAERLGDAQVLMKPVDPQVLVELVRGAHVNSP